MENSVPGNEVWCVVGTGQSLKVEDLEYVRGKCRVLLISNAYTLAPWADVLVSHDSNWWNRNRAAFKFSGKKYSRFEFPNVKKFNPPGFPRGCNSGLMGILVARSLGAKKIILLGFDMHGTHYFGKHPQGLKNTTPERFGVHIRQFTKFPDCEIINCTPNSSLKVYLKAELRETL